MPTKMMFKITDMMINVVNNILPSGQVRLRVQLVLFLDHVYLDISKSQYTDNVTNRIQLMIRLGVQFVGTLKNTTSLPFLCQAHNLKKKLQYLTIKLSHSHMEYKINILVIHSLVIPK